MFISTQSHRQQKNSNELENFYAGFKAESLPRGTQLASRNKLTLPKWIEATGDAKVVELLKVHETTVRHWRLGYGLPKAKQMLAIKRITRGRLTCDAMIETHFKTGSSHA